MTRIFTGVLSLLLLALGGQAQPTQWQRVKLDSLATAELPAGEVMRQEVKNQQVWAVNTDGTLYMLTMMENKFSSNPSETELNEGYDGVVKGLLQSGGGQVVRRTPVTIAGFPAIEVQYTTPSQPGTPALKITRVLVTNRQVFTQSFWADPANEKSLSASKDRFFASLQPGLTPTADGKVGGGRSNSLAYQSGYLFGRIAVIVGLIAGLIYFVRRRRPTNG